MLYVRTGKARIKMEQTESWRAQLDPDYAAQEQVTTPRRRNGSARLHGVHDWLAARNAVLSCRRW